MPDSFCLRATARETQPPRGEVAQTTWRGREEVSLPIAPSQASAMASTGRRVGEEPSGDSSLRVTLGGAEKAEMSWAHRPYPTGRSLINAHLSLFSATVF